MKICWISNIKPYINPMLDLNKIEAVNFVLIISESILVLSSLIVRNPETIRGHDYCMVIGIWLVLSIYLLIVLYFAIQDIKIIYEYYKTFLEKIKRILKIDQEEKDKE